MKVKDTCDSIIKKPKRTIEEQIREVVARGKAQRRAVFRKLHDSKGIPR